MSSNFFQFTQIWHFCNGLNPNKAQMSFVWGWNRQMRKKRETEKALSSIFSWDFWKMTLPLAYHLEFSVFLLNGTRPWVACLFLCSLCNFSVHTWSKLQERFWTRTTTTSWALVCSVDSGRSFFVRYFFSFLELFLVTLLHGKVFFFLQRKGKF